MVVDRTRRFLDFLAALARDLTSTPERDVRKIPDARPVWPEQLPRHPGVLLGPGEERPAWLTVHKVHEPARPELPASLVDEVVPASLDDFVAGPRLISPDSPCDERLREWTESSWRPWVTVVRPARAVRALYADLFGLHLLLQSNQTTHELVWGHGLLSWQVAGCDVLAPMLTTRVTIEIDADDGSLRLTPERPCELELDALEGLGLPLVEELAGLKERLRAAPPDPWLPGSLDQLYRQVVAPLGLDARIDDNSDVPAPGERPVLTPTWVVLARRRPVRHERFYTELAEVIDETGFLPEGVAAVVADDENVERAAVALGTDPGDSWRAVGEQLLMPLPSNDDQERIVRQLARARGVTVQGPPGTGKTHTIANLVSHLVAHGKRVLVTAQNEQALAVLRDKIPEELRDLSVAVLGSSPEAMDQLRASAQAMTDLVSGIDPERERLRIIELQTTVDALRAEIRRNELELVEALRAEESEFALPTGPAKAADVARWLADHEPELGVVPDAVAPTAVLPLSDPELAELHRRCTELDPADVAALRSRRPPTGALPVGAVLSDRHDRQDRLRQTVADLEADGLDLSGVDQMDAARLTELAALTRGALDRLDRLDQPWLVAVREAVRRSESFRAFWVEQVEALARRAAEIVGLQRRTVGWMVTVPDGDPRTQLDLLDELAERYAEGKGLPRLGSRDLRRLHEAVRINGLDLRTVDDVDVVRARIRLDVELAHLDIHLRQLAQQTPLPWAGHPTAEAGPALVPGVEALVRDLQDALAWEATDRPALVRSLRSAVTSLPDVPQVTDLEAAVRLLVGASTRREERELTRFLDGWSGHLDTGRDAENASSLWAQLRAAFAARSWDRWDELLAESARLDALLPELERRDTLLATLRSVAPEWADALDDGPGRATALDPRRWRDAWLWARADSWLRELHGRGRLEVLQRRNEALSDELADAVIGLAKRSAAVCLKENLKDHQRRALSAWLGSLTKLGKGTGKYASHWMQQARHELPEAMGAVPIWIMPVHRVIENFDPRRSELFDVVVVDESSQCDLLSVGVLALGRKSVVVGDDKQTSPAAVGADRGRVIQLQDLYLTEVPQKALLTVDESLYGIAERAFPDVVMLREHFRCVPEIIGFSNRYYDHRILPLREQTLEGIGPVLHAVHVPDGACTGTSGSRVNEAEAAALVRQVVACAHDTAYDRATFGVVCLQSGAQSRVLEQLLLQQLGLEEFQRRELRVGNAAAFQGDERDVVFVSVVADDNGYAATRTADKQRVNVAASRARDQLWVFHTVDPDTLHADDQRAALIRYVRDAAARRSEVADLAERCESGFERDVLRQLLDHGYRVTVQHQVGSYRIDLVVHGERDRLAVECDGDRFHGPEQWDDDLRRQRVLERLGWKFWRVLASTYYRAPDAALEALWDRLDQVGIRPHASGPVLPPAPAELAAVTR